MRRLLIAVLGSLLAVALIAPAAQGATNVRSLTLEGPISGGGIVRLNIDYLVKHRNGHTRLIPDRVTAFHYLYVPVSCEQGNQGRGLAWWEGGFGLGVTGVKITRKQFSYKYTATDPAFGLQSTLQFAGQKMWQGRTKWRPGHFDKPKPPGKKFFWKLASGVLNINEWDWPEITALNCTTNGPRSWSAHQCLRLSTDPVYLPLCARDF